MSSVLRGGRSKPTKKNVVNFISSLEDDQRIAPATVLINEAHVIALEKAKALGKSDARKILKALKDIEKHVPLRKGAEDVHVAIEEHVTKRTGAEVGGQLHLAKSRNDQVAAAIRATLRQEILEVVGLLLSLERVLLRLAHKHSGTVFPGYTHLQPAQPITFAHYLLANADALLRDINRFRQAYDRINLSPMGAAALAGTSFRLDRNLVSRLLGFRGIVENSLDAVGTRDFALEALCVFTILAVDLSRFAQDLIFYGSQDVDSVEIPDEFTSTSSIMPQKKNPDPLELIRAKCGSVSGNLTSATVIFHGLPSGYNLDFQEGTPILWRTAEAVKSCLRLLIQLIPRLKVNTRTVERVSLQFTAATEIANVLVRQQKIPFRTAHRVVGAAVRLALQRGRTMASLTQNEWERIVGQRLDSNTIIRIRRATDPHQLVDTYRTVGSPHPEETRRMIRSRAMEIRIIARENSRALAALKKSVAHLHAAARRV
jgi:argininosuccinate lyase